MSDTMIKKVAIYCRVSTQEQAEEGYSLEEQQRLIREYCQQKNYEVAMVYEDAGISGKDIRHRPAMQQLLEDASKKKFHLVMSWKINRISRKLSDAIKIVETLEKYGIGYQSYSEPFESSTPAGKMQFQMMALVGEFERNTIAQNVKMGMRAKAMSGEWCGGIPPFGYCWVTMEGKLPWICTHPGGRQSAVRSWNNASKRYPVLIPVSFKALSFIFSKNT